MASGALVCAVMGAIAAASYGFVAGPRAFDILAYHVDRPVQVESPYGAMLMLADAFHHGMAQVVWGYGSDNVQSTVEPTLRRMSSVVLALSILGVFVWIWRIGDRFPDDPSRNRAALTAFTAVLIAFIGLGKVFSPQYLVWIFPTAVICAAVSSERSRLLLIGAAIMTQIEYPFIYHANVSFVSTLIAGVVICRDILLVGCALSLMIEALRAMEEPAAETRLNPPFTASP